jgi:very-short-patch-repair endonuclease
MGIETTKKGLKIYSPKKKTNKAKKERARKNLQQYINPDGSRKESSIEKKMREFLEDYGLYFKQEKFLQWHGKWKSYDFYVTDGEHYNILIECDGEYYHPDEGQRKLNKLQRQNRRNDNFKDELAKAFGIPLLRFREKQIKFKFDEVRKAILAEIERQKKSEP